MPLVSSLWLSKKPGREAWLEPRTSADGKTIEWTVRCGVGSPGDPPKAEGRGKGFRCLVCGNHADASYIHDEIDAGRQNRQLIAVVAAAPSGRAYISPTAADVEAAQAARDVCTRDISVDDLPDEPARGTFGGNAQGRRYGFRTFSDYFLPRQLTALTTFVALIGEARAQIRTDAVSRVGADGGSSSDQGAAEYADAVATYLAFAIDKAVDYWSSVCGWHSSRELIRNTFARQAISMVWDSAEANPFSGGAGCWDGAVEWVARSVAALPALGAADVRQLDAMQAVRADGASLVSTDPPYYDNIGYADLADFFYVWLRRSLRDVYPDLFSTLLTPKRQELIASKYRFEGSSEKAQAFFESGLALVFERLRVAGNPDYPLTVYYAFKQAEAKHADAGTGVASTGWETMLSGLLSSGFSVTGTWPLRSEMSNRSVASGTNALASSVVLACRPRPGASPLATRKEFVGALRAELPDALKRLQRGNIAPVDLAQASIGPGMAVFSRYAKVLETDGSQMAVRTALSLINEALDEILAEQEGEFDADTRWAITWFEQQGFNAGPFGDADNMCRAKNTSVQGMVEAGIIEAKGGKVQLLRREALDDTWDPATDRRLTVWEVTQHLIRRLDEGESAAASLVRQLGSYAEVARDLAYRLYLVCERKKWSQEGQAYNALVVAWPEIQRLAAAEPASVGPTQTSFEV